MTSIHHAHHHRSPPCLKKTTVKSHRPALSKSLGSPKLAGKAGKNKLAEEHLETAEEDDDMAASFLQYWYVDDHRGVGGLGADDLPVPCARNRSSFLTILFFTALRGTEHSLDTPPSSDTYRQANMPFTSCRRKDGNKTSPADAYLRGYNTIMPAFSEPADVFGLTTRSIVARRRPTVLSTDVSKPPLLHHFKSDLDPTEWKPDSIHRSASEANNYLSQFHGSSPGVTKTRRPALNGRSTTSALIMAQVAPSLSHTPTTSLTSSEGSIAGTPYEFVASIDTSEGHGTLCSISTSAKTVEVVAPVVADGSPPSPIKETKLIKKSHASPIIGDLVYEKKWVPGSVEHVTGSLKKLLYLQQIGEVGGSAEM
ncbi:hypothetical protein MMC26_005669 [Xylographa opegraphella]|nr:hypothetical protein [Xylographa opegraphella]